MNVFQSISWQGFSKNDCRCHYQDMVRMNLLTRLQQQCLSVFLSRNCASLSPCNVCLCYFQETVTLYLLARFHQHHHHYHHVVPQARISLTLSRHFSISFIASGRSSGLHPVSSHSCCMYVRAGRPAFARPYVGFHRNTSLMSSSLLLPQYPACLVRLTLIVVVIGGRWPYSWCFMGRCHQDLFNIALNILV